MKFIKNKYSKNLHCQKYALTIGNFDGFHLGHQNVIKKLYIEGIKRNLPLMAIIFEPHPDEFFCKKFSQKRIMILRDKVRYLTNFGVDVVSCITFNEKFSKISAYSFVKDFLIDKIGIKFICVGEDFRFGEGRLGNYDFLKYIGKSFGFDTASVPIYLINNKRVSSTNIRKALSNGRLLEVEKMLGHPYDISGKVIQGDSIGRYIGFPTANILIKQDNLLVNGVYIVEVHGIYNHPIRGVANIGRKPTIKHNLNKFKYLEVHLLNVKINIYGKKIIVVIKKKIRDEKKFISLNELKDQIKKDIESTNDYFKSL